MAAERPAWQRKWEKEVLAHLRKRLQPVAAEPLAKRLKFEKVLTPRRLSLTPNVGKEAVADPQL